MRDEADDIDAEDNGDDDTMTASLRLRKKSCTTSVAARAFREPPLHDIMSADATFAPPGSRRLLCSASMKEARSYLALE